MTHPPRHGALPVHPEGRKATWFELFFDLVFVVAVARLAGAYAHHYDADGALTFAFAFLAMWWCWLGHTFYATRFDEDKPSQRTLGLVFILAVAWVGYGASGFAGPAFWVFASGIAVFKLLLALAYIACWHWHGARGLIRSYAWLYAVQAMLWAASLWVTGHWPRLLWGTALLLDLASPWWVARYTHQVPPHPEHLPERFGLFTIILLGEAMAAVVHALDHGPKLTMDALVAGGGGALLTFMVWLGYFDRTRAHGHRQVSDPHGGRNLRLWAYAHVPLYLGIASLAAGVVFLSGQSTLAAMPRMLFSAGVASIMVGLSVLGVASVPRGSASSWRRAGKHLGVVLIYLAFMFVVDLANPAQLLGAAAMAFVVQLGLARAQKA